MKSPNIDFLIEMTRSYLDGEIDSITYKLDFPYELEARYKKLLKEDRALTEVIYDCLLEDGVFLYDDLEEEEFKQKITQEYEYVTAIYLGNVDMV